MARLKKGDVQVNGTQTGRTEMPVPNAKDVPRTAPSKRAELLAILAEADVGLNKKDLTNGSQANFNFRDGEMYTFNDEVGVRCKLPAWWTIPQGSIPGAKFKEIMAKITDDDIDISLVPSESGGELVISGNMTSEKAGLNLDLDPPFSTEWFGPRAADMTEDHFISPLPIPDGFLKGLRLCSFSVSTNMTNYWMVNVFMGGNELFACDGYRATKIALGMQLTNSLSYLAIPYNAVPAILGFDAQSYTYNSKWLVLFKPKAQLFIKLAGEFDDTVYTTIKHVSEQMDNSTDFSDIDPINLPDGLEALIDKAGIFAAGDAPIDKHIELRFAPGNIIVRSEQQGVGWIEAPLPAPDCAQEFTMIVAPSLLSEALHAGREMHVDAQLKKCMFKGENFVHTLMLFG